MRVGNRTRALTRHPTICAAAFLACVAIAARALDFGNPIVFVDEEFYYITARAIAHGALPYVDIWDRKPVGLFLVYLPAGMFDPPASIWVFQLLALASVVGTALLIHRIAGRAGWKRGALIAAALYILWLDLADGQSGQSPVFYNLPMAAAASLIQSATAETSGRARFRRGLAAMTLTGMAIQIKYSAVFEGLFFGLWLLWLEWRTRAPLGRIVSRSALLVTMAIAPTALVITVYATFGHLDAFLFANFASILARNPDSLRASLGNLATDTLILGPLLALAAGGMRGDGAPESALERRFSRSWLLAALGGFVIFGSWFNHYTLPVMVPAACCASAVLGRTRWGPGLGLALGLLALVAGQFVLVHERTMRGTPAEFARIAAAVGRGAGALYVYSGSTMLYATSGRPALTPYVFPTHLMLARESGAIGVDQVAEINRILDRRPEIVVVQERDAGERTDIRAMVLSRLARDGYRADAPLPYGHYPNTIYRARR